MDKSVSVIIPSWNGKHLLERNLPFLFQALQKTNIPNEVVVVDDGSQDDTAQFLRNYYPKIKLIKLEVNQGFAHACNIGASESKNSIIYLLNNDVKVRENFLEPVVEHFEKNDVFAVSSREIAIDGSYGNCHFLNWVKFKFGIFWNYYKEIKDPFLELPAAIFAVSGGHSALDREKFIALNGFDEIYRPFYWEDVDICYRAWKKGWKSLYEPRSTVYHFSKGTIGKRYNRIYIKSIRWRNRFLFTWKNLKDNNLLFQHFLFLPLSVIMAPFLGHIFFSIGFLFALRYLKDVARKRKEEINDLFSDAQVLALFQERRWIKK